MANSKPTKTHGPTVLAANVPNIVGELQRLVAVAGVAAAAGKRRNIDGRSLVIRGK
jgi:hypothetical protein